MGIFYPFLNDASVKLIGVEAAGKGLNTEQHSASLARGRPGVLHGTKSYFLQDDNAQIKDVYSIAPGLDYPGVGPEPSYLKETGRISIETVTDDQAMEGFDLLTRNEGIMPVTTFCKTSQD